eukprot:CAMPEP_0184017856 /NCGR_PEP_ID=MMETSP0954-20121128/7794_1 /TAXON_ID=627963 /ORGANISM="Aplanochytrium sp, Strain PBS07" /LENGTH=442 /DNA_ID=CAMNT_0026299189 /DNA_START=591 /DNA_END=1919 /DNA_ORIENTATION=-
MTIDEIGLLGVCGFVDSASVDVRSHAGLMLIGSIFSILAQTFAFFSLFAFDAKAERLRIYLRRENVGQTLADLNKSNLNWEKIFGVENQNFWWMFVALQICISVYAGVIAFLIDMSFLKNAVIQRIIVVVFAVLMTITVSLTNTIGGKWRYGGARYRLFMPGQGGLQYVALQAFGWTSFAGSLVFTVFKMYDLANASESSLQLMRAAGVLGLMSEACLIMSLFVFDPSKSGPPEELTQEDDEVDILEMDDQVELRSPGRGRQNLRQRRGRQRSRSRGAELKSKKNVRALRLNVERIIGKRPSPKLKGTIEYLVQWKYPSMSTWEDEPALIKKSTSGKQFVLRAIAKYEQQLADMVSHTLSESDKDRMKTKKSSTSKTSEVVSAPNKSIELVDQESDSVDEEYLLTDTKGEIWEECEDEEGNLFYVNLRTGVSVIEIPAVASN